MTPEQRALRDAYLSETWAVCRELPREERAAERARAEAVQECAELGDKGVRRAAS